VHYLAGSSMESESKTILFTGWIPVLLKYCSLFTQSESLVVSRWFSFVNAVVLVLRDGTIILGPMCNDQIRYLAKHVVLWYLKLNREMPICFHCDQLSLSMDSKHCQCCCLGSPRWDYNLGTMCNDQIRYLAKNVVVQCGSCSRCYLMIELV